MRGIFNLDSPVMQFLSRMADLMILNILFIVCSLPVITIGASLAAMHRVTQNMVFEQGEGVAKAFFRAFRQNFRQATIVWLAALVLAASLICDFFLIMANLGGSTANVMYGVLVILAVLVFGVFSYIMPLIARYENTLRQQLTNALVLTLIKLPKTLLLIVLNLLPVILFLAVPPIFAQSLILWVLLGFALMSFLGSCLLKKVFREMEKSPDSEAIG